MATNLFSLMPACPLTFLSLCSETRADEPYLTG